MTSNSVILPFLAATLLCLASCNNAERADDKGAEQPSIETTNDGVQMDPEIQLEGHKIRVMQGPYVSDGSPTPEANEFAAKLISMLPDMKKVASASLLETYNDSWLDDDHDKLTAEQFIANLTSPELVIYDAIGAATIYFPDSDMFGGHMVAVSVWEGEIDDASLK